MRRELDSLVTQMHSSGIRYEDAVREFKRQYLREVLVAHRGNQCKAAEELGMHRNTLSRTMAGLGLSLASAVATLHGGELRLDDAHPGLVATLVIPARAGSTDRLAAQTQDVPQKVA